MSPTAELPGRLRRVGRVRVAVIAAAAVALLVLLTVLGGRSSPHQASLAPAAKPFTLAVLGHPGEHISLQAFSGRPLIVNFFASWCPPCRRETPMIARFYRSRHGNPPVIGIDSNDRAFKALAFVAKSGVTYPVVSDPYPARIAVAYDVPGLPATFFLDARHRIVKRVYGALTAAELSTGAALITGHG